MTLGFQNTALSSSSNTSSAFEKQKQIFLAFEPWSRLNTFCWKPKWPHNLSLPYVSWLIHLISYLDVVNSGSPTRSSLTFLMHLLLPQHIPMTSRKILFIQLIKRRKKQFCLVYKMLFTMCLHQPEVNCGSFGVPLIYSMDGREGKSSQLAVLTYSSNFHGNTLLEVSVTSPLSLSLSISLHIWREMSPTQALSSFMQEED